MAKTSLWPGPPGPVLLICCKAGVDAIPSALRHSLHKIVINVFAVSSNLTFYAAGEV